MKSGFSKYLFPMDLQLHAEPGDPPPGDPPKGDPPKGDPPKATEPFATFPDEKSFMKAIGQKTDAQLKKLAEELGFDSVEALKAAAKSHKEKLEADKSDLEKERDARKKAELEKTSALETANKRLIDAEIRIAAQEAGFADYTDAVALVDRAEIKIDDDGNITGVSEAIKALAKAKPHLIGETKPPGSPGSPGNPNRQKGTPGDKGSFGKELAEKRAQAAKNTSQAQGNYFS